jgi:excisionase family DNA binding protein
MTDAPRTLSISEAAKVLGVDRATLYRLRDGNVIDLGDRKLTLLKIGRRFRVPAGELARVLGEVAS